MCGIDGFFSADRVISGVSFYAAHRLLAHRGPDDEGFVARTPGGVIPMRGDTTAAEHDALPDVRGCEAASVLLGHRRLSIIDLTSGGYQPMSSPDGRYWMVYNGEVYNYLELRKELECLGHSFSSASDTEVILHAFMEWGPQACSRFNGMWALALWDTAEESLLLSRDRFGIKPLFYSVRNGAMRFASEMKFILACDPAGFEPNPSAVDAYVHQARLFADTDTFWAGIDEVLPGHYLEYRDGGVSATRYWHLEPSVEIDDMSVALERFGELFDDSLRLRLRSDVRVGSLLSGGLDSSLIVARLHELGLLGSGTFASFSAVSDDERFSERQYVEALAARLPLEKHLVEFDSSHIEEYLDALFRHIEVPYRSLAVLAQHLLYEAVRRETDVKVLLNGQGGDELFGGYTNQYFVLLGILLRKGRLMRLDREGHALARNRGLGMRYILDATLPHARAADSGWAYFNELTALEVTESALREYLAYDDRNSMAFSVEARVPYLDYRIVEFAFSLHPDLKIKEFVNKRLVREWARGRLPEEIRDRRDKMGFTTPQEAWQRGPMASAMAAEASRMREHGFGGLLPTVSRDLGRYASYIDGTDDGWTFAWRLFCLSRWMEAHDLV